jgi:hypothetical protein
VSRRGRGGTNLAVSHKGQEGAESLPTVALSERRDVDGVPVLSRPEHVRRIVRHRRLGLAVLSAVVAVAATGWLGVKSVDSHASGDGLDLEVHHAAVTRSGLASPVRIRVRQADGFEGPVQLGISAGYLALFDVSAVVPTPTSEWTRGDLVVWEMEPPDGELLEVRLDARIEPARSTPGSGTVAVLDETGEPLVETDVRTVVLP